MKILPGYCLAMFLCWIFNGHSFAADVLTFHNDNAHTGLNSQEAKLTPWNVNRSSFGLLRNLPVDGAVFAQPLYVSNAQVISAGQSQGFHNLLIVATEHDSVYAFDADSNVLYWHVSLLRAGEVPSDGRGCEDLLTENGVTSTPVIDRAIGLHGTIYVLAMSKTPDNANYFDRLYALDLATGLNVLSPVTIQASYPGNGPANTFDAAKQRGRAGLLLTNGTIYTEWGSFCDFAPYSGWIIAYNERTLAKTAVFNSDPNGRPASPSLPDGSGSGIWQAGQPASVDANGNLYVATGNGPFDTNLIGGFPASSDYGDTFLKLTASLKVTDYFTPFDQLALAENDGDFGSGGTVLLDISDRSNVVHHLAITAGKDTNLYVLNRDNLGKFSPNTNSIYQELDAVLTPGGVWSSPAYFNGSIYYDPQLNSLLQFQFTANAMLDPVPLSATATAFPFPGGVPSISSNGNTNGIVWIQEARPGQVVLHAYDATDLATELFSSGGVNFGAPTKFAPPTVCNGKVFVGTMNSVGVFGLLGGFAPSSGTVVDSRPVDFNGDGNEDILWRNTLNGDTWIWLMNGNSIEASGRVAIVDLSWTIVGVGNFDGQGRRDIVWYNAPHGRVAIWTMNGFTETGSYEFQAPVGSPGEWAVVGIADFDHTGLSDILWQDARTGALYMWKSVSPLMFATIGIGTADPSWRVVGAADVEGNGLPDIIWHNSVTGGVYIWQLRNDQVSQEVFTGRYSLGWEFAGFGNFNGDGFQDILWRNNSTGDVCVWLMNGLSIASQWFPGAPGLAWQVVGTPDLNGDGRNDILWLDPSAGLVTAWLGMPTYLAQPPPFASVGAGWTVAPSQ
jgi:FG-GAP-like repeat